MRGLKIAAYLLLLMIGATALIGSGIAPAAYNLIENSGTPLARRSTLNFVNGGCVDNAGQLRTDCTFVTSIPANVSCSFTSQTSVTCTHNLNTLAVNVTVYNAASPPALILPASVSLTSVNVVTVTFSTSTSGTIIVSGSSGSGGGGSSYYQTIQVAGVSQPQEPALNFAANVTCTDTAGVSTNCTPSGGGGGGVPTTGWTLTQPSGALATLSDFASTGIALNQESQPVGGGVHFAVATQTIPGSTYTIVSTQQCQATVGTTGAQVLVCGLALFDGTKFEDIEFLNTFNVNNMQLAVRQGTSLTSGGSLVAGPTNTLIGQYPTFKVVDDGTHRTWYYWGSGAYHQFYQEASGAFLTPTTVGAITLNDSGSNPVFNTVLIVGWTATSP